MPSRPPLAPRTLLGGALEGRMRVTSARDSGDARRVEAPRARTPCREAARDVREIAPSRRTVAPERLNGQFGVSAGALEVAPTPVLNGVRIVAECSVCGTGGLQSVGSCAECGRPICGMHLVMRGSPGSYFYSIDYVLANGRDEFCSSEGATEGQQRLYQAAWIAGERRCISCRSHAGLTAISGQRVEAAAAANEWYAAVTELPSRAAAAMVARGVPTVRLLQFTIYDVSRKGNRKENRLPKVVGQRVEITADLGVGWPLVSGYEQQVSEDQYSSTSYSLALATNGAIFVSHNLPQLPGSEYSGQWALGVSGSPVSLKMTDYDHYAGSARHRALRGLPRALAAMVDGSDKGFAPTS